MENSNLEMVKQKLFSTKSSSEQMNDEIRMSVNRIREEQLRRLRPSQFKGQEDSDYGEKTFKAMFNVLKNYPLDVVKRFVKLGAINNHIWQTKNNNKIDTDKVVETVSIMLDERRV